MSETADESVDGRIREMLAGAKACRSEREMKAARAIWHAAEEAMVNRCAQVAEVIADEQRARGDAYVLAETVAAEIRALYARRGARP